MDEVEAAVMLQETYQDAPRGRKDLDVILFGIRYPDELSGMNISRMVRLANITPKHSHDVNVNYGIRLAEFVEMRA